MNWRLLKMAQGLPLSNLTIVHAINLDIMVLTVILLNPNYKVGIYGMRE